MTPDEYAELTALLPNPQRVRDFHASPWIDPDNLRDFLARHTPVPADSPNSVRLYVTKPAPVEPAAEDVEALARELCATDPTSTSRTWDHVRESHRIYRREHAAAFLTSGWLAQRDARVVAEAHEHECDYADTLSELLCDLTGGRLSKPTYPVRTMIQAIEEEFDRHAADERADAAREPAQDEREQVAEVIAGIDGGRLADASTRAHDACFRAATALLTSDWLAHRDERMKAEQHYHDAARFDEYAAQHGLCLAGGMRISDCATGPCDCGWEDLPEQIRRAKAEAWDEALDSCNDYSAAAPNPYRAEGGKS